MANNYQRLKEEADIETVVNALSIPTYNKGQNIFIHCPLPDHNDKNPTNCYFKRGWNNVYCSRCGKSIKAIDLIMYTAGLEYGAAADMLWEIEGCPPWYYDRDYGKNTEESFHISGTEAKTIGLTLPHGIEEIISYHEDKPDLGKHVSFAPTTVGWLAVKRKDAVWQDLIDENELKRLVLDKCNEKLALYDDVEKDFRKYGVDVSLFGNQREIIADLKKRCAS